jgi:hypothetical protein
MDGSRFDRIATHIVDHRLSRRRMLGRAGAGLAPPLGRRSASPVPRRGRLPREDSQLSSVSTEQGTRPQDPTKEEIEMDASRFDGIAKIFAARRLSRRRALAGGGAGLATAGLAAAGLAGAAAQGATPAPAGEAGEKTEFLFVQSFESGTIAPKQGAAGTYALTLAHGLGQTLYFSDRPERIVGAAPTPKFLDGLGFSPADPPNAALVVEAAPGNEDIAVLELLNPRYDEATRTATYDAKVLEDWERSLAMGFAEAPTDLAQLAPSFGAAHLFIDDCLDWNSCYKSSMIGTPLQYVGAIPGGPIGACWSWSNWQCLPDNPNCIGGKTDYYNDLCTNTYAQSCPYDSGGCLAGP